MWTASLVKLLVVWLNTTSRPTWGHSMHFCDQAPWPSPLMKSPNKGANGAQKYNQFRENGPVNSGAPPPKVPAPPPFGPPQNRLIIYQSLSFRRQDSEYRIYILIDMWSRRVFFNFVGWHVYFLGWAPLSPWGITYPPNPPSSAPTRQKRVPFCSFLNCASICIFIKTWNDNAAELRGKKQDTVAQPHMTHQAPITGLHNSTLLPFFQSSMLAQSWKFGVSCCSIALTHPAACTGALVPLTFGNIHSTLPFTQFAQKGGNN